MRIGYVTQWFPPEPGTVVASAIATGLVNLGHEVDVLTGFPNYPTGRLMPGYPLRPYRRDTGPGGVAVHRAPLYPSHSTSAVGRAANYLSFAAGAALVGRSARVRPDAWLVYSSPATTLIPAIRLMRRHRAPIFMVIMDLWPDSVTGSGFVGGRAGASVERGLTSFCDWSYRAAAGIGVTSPGMRNLLVERGVPDEKIFDTPNWVDDDYLSPDAVVSPEERCRLGLPAGRLFMYAGNLGELQGLDPLVRAFAKRPEAQLVLVGDGVARERLVSIAQDIGAPNIRFLPQVPVDEVGRLIAASDVQLVSLQNTPLLQVTTPSKLQTTLAAARPALVHAAGDAARIVTEAGAGWAAAPGDEEGLLRAIDLAVAASHEELTTLGRNSRATYLKHYSAVVGPRRLAGAMTVSMAAAHRRVTRDRSDPS